MGDAELINERALIVDDEPAIRRHVTRAALRVFRFADEAADGSAAIACYEQHRYPIVILDLMMPGLHGIEVLRQIRAMNPSVQVIILSGHGQKDDVIKALNLRAFRYCEKPMGVEDIVTASREAFQAYQHAETIGKAGLEDALEREIQQAYDDLAEVARERDARPNDPDVEARWRRQFAELRAKQQVEANHARALFRESLPLKPGEGTAALAAARKALRDGKDPP